MPGPNELNRKDVDVDISCMLPSGPDTPAWIELAEQLGYRRAWCFDTPPLCSDVWMTLALAATRTERIGLGPGMMIPSLRHVATNAVAAATLHGLAPGRVSIGVGTGLTARRLMGQRAMRWSEVVDYVQKFRALLRHEAVEVDGRQVRLCHPAGQRPAFPLELPVLPAIIGPVGTKAAIAMGAAGLVSPGPIPPEFDWGVRPLFGTILDPGESPTSDRVVAAAGPGAAVVYHLLYDSGQDIDGLQGGIAWRTALEALPEEERTVAQWAGHLVHLNELDRAHIRREAIPQLTMVVTAEEVAERIAAMADEGVTEIALHPAGDIPEELRRFAKAARIAAVTA